MAIYQQDMPENIEFSLISVWCIGPMGQLKNFFPFTAINFLRVVGIKQNRMSILRTSCGEIGRLLKEYDIHYRNELIGILVHAMTSLRYRKLSISDLMNSNAVKIKYIIYTYFEKQSFYLRNKISVYLATVLAV